MPTRRGVGLLGSLARTLSKTESRSTVGVWPVRRFRRGYEADRASPHSSRSSRSPSRSSPRSPIRLLTADLVLAATPGRGLRLVGLHTRQCPSRRSPSPSSSRWPPHSDPASSSRFCSTCPPRLRRRALVAIAADGNSAGPAHGGHTRGGGCGPGPVRARRSPSGSWAPSSPGSSAAPSRATGSLPHELDAHPPRARRAGAARRAAADRARRPRLRGARAGRRDAPGDERHATCCAATSPRPRTRCVRPRRWAVAACRSFVAR